MVHQLYIHRLALGRSAWEPPTQQGSNRDVTRPSSQGRASNFIEDLQEETPTDQIDHADYIQAYNFRGHAENPASRALVKRTIRAYNEVLETVGVCAKKDGKIVLLKSNTSFTPEQDEAIIEENEAGFWLDLVHCVLSTTASAVFRNLRRRLITFTYYSGISLKHIITVEYSRQGFVSFFLAGVTVELVTDLLQNLLPALIDVGSEIIQTRFTGHSKDKTKDTTLLTSVRRILIILKHAIPYTLIPMHAYSSLQQLGLIPLWPLLPNPFTKAYLRILFPELPGYRIDSSPLSWIPSLLLSPAITYAIMRAVTKKAERKLRLYSNTAIPRPDNPDSLSLRITQIPDFEDAAQVSDFDTFQCTFRETFDKDTERVQAIWQGLYSHCQQALDGFSRFKKTCLIFVGAISVEVEEPYPPVRFTELSIDPATGLPSGLYVREPEADIRSSSTADTVSQVATLSSSSSDDDDADDGTNTGNVRVRTRNGSTSTIHMDVEFNNTDTSDGQPFTSSFIASATRPSDLEATSGDSSRRPQHRVTGLSLHGVDTLSSLVVQTIVSTMQLPLESLYLRSLVRAFLLQQPQPNWLLPKVYSRDIWFGHGLHAGTASIWEYTSKVLFCIGFDSLVNLQVWRVGSRLALLWGTNVYGWGRL